MRRRIGSGADDAPCRPGANSTSARRSAKAALRRAIGRRLLLRGKKALRFDDKCIGFISASDPRHHCHRPGAMRDDAFVNWLIRQLGFSSSPENRDHGITHA